MNKAILALNRRKDDKNFVYFALFFNERMNFCDYKFSLFLREDKRKTTIDEFQKTFFEDNIFEIINVKIEEPTIHNLFKNNPEILI